MKRYNDTYAALSEERCALHPELLLSVSDPRTREALTPFVRAEGTVRALNEHPLDGAVHAMLREQFADCEAPRGDAYAVHIEPNAVHVYANTDVARRYALVALVTHMKDAEVPLGWIYNVPLCDFRAIKIYLPKREEIPFFGQLMHMCMVFGLNTCVIEVGGAMEYERHPEINEGWVRYAAEMYEYNGKTMHANHTPPFGRNSIHIENAGGGFLTKAEVRALVDTAASYGIEMIPELPLLSHSDYLLASHPELAEMKDDPIPCCYCPSNPDVYKLTFDLLDEVIEVFRPRTVHVAHDEWWTHGRCDACRGKDPARQFADDLIIYYNYLKERGIQTMFWGDAMINCFGTDGEFHPGAATRIRYTPTDRKVTLYGKEYPVYNGHWDYHADEVKDVPGSILFEIEALYPCIDMIPKDIAVMNWYHTLDPSSDDVYIEHGFYNTVYGNFTPLSFTNWFARIEKGVRGASISNWSATDGAHMQHRCFFLELAYMSEMLWSRDFKEEQKLDNLRASAAALFAYRETFLPRAEHTVELLYTSDRTVAYAAVLDGCMVDNDLFRLGQLVIEYADGTAERRDILWGENIGPSDALSLKTWRRIAEPLYTCGIEEDADGTVWYRTYYNLGRAPKSVRIETAGEDAVRVRELKFS